MNNYYCEICDKNYKNENSLVTHIYKFHKKDETIKKEKKIKGTNIKDENIKKGKNIKEKNIKEKNIKEDLYCKYCNLKFTFPNNKYRHQKICKLNLSNIIPIVNTVTPTNITSTINNSNNTGIINNNNGTINNNNINETINNNNIIINNYAKDNFNKDNFSYLSERFIMKLLDNVITDDGEKGEPLYKLVQTIKFNINHKENHNVKITNDRSRIGFVYDKKWKAIDKDDLLEDLLYYSYRLLVKFYDDRKDNLDEDIISSFDEFKKIYNDDVYRNKIKEKILSIAYVFTLNHLS